MKVDQIPAGPKMDALVGERIFGHKVLGMVHCMPDHEIPHWYHVMDDGPPEDGVLRPVYLAHCVCDLPKDEWELEDADYFGHTAGCLEPEPDWSAYVELAWQVVEKMRDMGFLCRISDNGNTHAANWDVRFFHRDYPHGSNRRGIAIELVIAEAICRAALKAEEER